MRETLAASMSANTGMCLSLQRFRLVTLRGVFQVDLPRWLYSRQIRPRACAPAAQVRQLELRRVSRNCPKFLWPWGTNFDEWTLAPLSIIWLDQVLRRADLSLMKIMYEGADEKAERSRSGTV